MVGLNIESIVSFPHNTSQTGEGVIGAVIPVTASWIHCPHTPNNLLPSYVLFQAENVPKPFSATPDSAQGEGGYDAPPAA